MVFKLRLELDDVTFEFDGDYMAIYGAYDHSISLAQREIKELKDFMAKIELDIE